MERFLAVVESKLWDIKSKHSSPLIGASPIRAILHIISIKQFDNLKEPTVHDLMSTYCMHGNRQADSLLISKWQESTTH